MIDHETEILRKDTNAKVYLCQRQWVAAVLATKTRPPSHHPAPINQSSQARDSLRLNTARGSTTKNYSNTRVFHSQLSSVLTWTLRQRTNNLSKPGKVHPSVCVLMKRVWLPIHIVHKVAFPEITFHSNTTSWWTDQRSPYYYYCLPVSHWTPFNSHQRPWPNQPLRQPIKRNLLPQ